MPPMYVRGGNLLFTQDWGSRIHRISRLVANMGANGAAMGVALHGVKRGQKTWFAMVGGVSRTGNGA